MKPILRYSLAFLLVLVTMSSCNLFSAVGLSSQGQPTKEVKGNLTSTTANSAVNVDHAQWDALLKKHVDQEGWVDYKGFKKDKAQLNAYLEKVSALKPTDDWSVQELLAYYINVYNAYTIDAIVQNYPLNSIKDISGVWTSGNVPIAGTNLSLGGIENGILRKMNEPRIHFAINCASVSCPKLLNEAYTSAKINEQLDRATLDFINGDKNEITANAPQLSSIFSFYPKDFQVDGKQDIIGYINQYSTTKINQDAPLAYINYDWNLNDKK